MKCHTCWLPLVNGFCPRPHMHRLVAVHCELCGEFGATSHSGICDPCEIAIYQAGGLQVIQAQQQRARQAEISALSISPDQRGFSF